MISFQRSRRESVPVLAVPLQLLEAADRVVEVAGLEREAGQRRLRRGQQRGAGLDLLDRLVADDVLERLGGLGDGAGAAVELGLPVLDDLVVGVLLQGGVEVLDGLAHLAALERELGVEDVDGGGLLPSGADPGDDGRGLVEPVLRRARARRAGPAGRTSRIARRCPRSSSRAWSGFLRSSAWIWARIMTRPCVVRLGAEEFARGRRRPPRACRP